jgi:hypothetical protein
VCIDVCIQGITHEQYLPAHWHMQCQT